MKVYAVILGAGAGRRMGGTLPKQFMLLGGKPIIAHTLEAFQSHKKVNHILIVTHEDYISKTREIISKYKITKALNIIAGGEHRYDSSYIAIKHLKCADDDIVIIQDAVRPFVTKTIIDDCINLTKEHGASEVAVKCTDTISEIEDGFVSKIMRREKLYNVQTPQCFKYRIILDAHEQAKKECYRDATDDVSLVLRTGYKVRIVEGEYDNIKITTPLDMKIAENILTKRIK
mgnify:CR=1 FL=1